MSTIPTHDNRVYYEFMKSFTSIILYLDTQKNRLYGDSSCRKPN